MTREDDLDEELKQAIKEKTGLHKIIERYGIGFPDEVIKIKQKQTVTDEEASQIIYCTQEIYEKPHPEKPIDVNHLLKVSEFMCTSRDRLGISLISQVKTYLAINAWYRKLYTHFRYYTEKGYPASIIKTHLVVTILYDFFRTCLEDSSTIPLAWLCAVFTSSFNGYISKPDYEVIISTYKDQQLQELNFYTTGSYIINNLDLSIADNGAISTSLFEYQIKDTYPILFTAHKEETNFSQITLAASAFADDPSFALIPQDLLVDLLREVDKELEFTYPSASSLETEALTFFQSQTVPGGSSTKYNQFLILAKQQEQSLFFLLHTSKVERTNYTAIKEFLDFHLSQLKSMDDAVASEAIQEWIDYLHVVSTIPNFFLSDDTDPSPDMTTIMDRDWSLNSLALSESIGAEIEWEIYGKSEQDCRTVESFHKFLINLNSSITSIIGSTATQAQQLLPQEALTQIQEYGEKSYHSMLYCCNEKRIAFLQLQEYIRLNPPSHYINKSDKLKLPVVQMKLNDLLQIRESDSRLDWIQDRLGVDPSTLVESKSTLPFVNYLRYSHQQVSQISTDNNSQFEENQAKINDRLQLLEKLSSSKLEIQTQLFQFIVPLANEFLLQSLLNSSKVIDFVDQEYRENTLKQSRQKVEDLKQLYDIYKLTGGVGTQALDIVMSLDTLVRRDLSEVLFKLTSLQNMIASMTQDHLEQLLEQLNSVEEG